MRNYRFNSDEFQIETKQIPIQTVTTGNAFWVKVSGIWKKTITYVKVSGVWKIATPFYKLGGTWR